MPFFLADEIPECRQALLDGIPRLGRALFSPAQLKRLTSATPISTWTLDGSIGPFTLGKSVTSSGFLYLLMDGDRPVGLSEVVKRAKGRWEFANLTTAFARPLCQAIERASSHRDLQKGKFEVRFLHAPVQHVEAVWFYGLTGSFFWALPPAVRQLKLRNPCPAERFFSRLQEHFPHTPLRKLSQSDGPREGHRSPR